MVIRGQVSAEKLAIIYDVINRLIDNDDCYYSEEELEELKQGDKIFIQSKG